MTDLRERLGEVADLERTALLLAWDQETTMPPAGAAARAEQRASVERLAHERFTDGHVGELLEIAQPGDELEVDLLRVTRRDHDKAVRVPTELVGRLARAGAHGHTTWAAAREQSDFALFAPALQTNVALRREYAACFPDAARPYDALLDDFEPELTTDEARVVLDAMRDGLVELVQAAGETDDAIVHGGPFAREAQRGLVQTVLAQVGVDEQRWRLDVAEHPFQATIGLGDVRLTTRYDERDLDSLFSTLHEFGHGLYEAGIDPALARTPLAGGVSSAMHESQSRLWENMVGRGPGFWRWCFPHLKAAFPDRFAGAAWSDVQRAVNAVRPSLIRVSADEVTYGLHIALRFELELGLFEGDLVVADLPAAWNERMRAYLGLDVPDDAHGVLQDVHWAEGLFGYFPTYALGNVIAGQLWARITDELPELEESFASGDFAPLSAWLAQHVHRHGRRLGAQETIRRAAGAPMDPAPYLAYLAAKVSASASLMP